MNYLKSSEIENINPHILRFSEYHTEEQDLLHITLASYILGSSFCHQNLHEVCVIVLKKIYIPLKLIYHIIVKKTMWKFVLLNVN